MFKGQANDLIRRLPIVVEDQQIARLAGRLLLNAERAIPVDRLIQHLDDLLAGHRRDHGRCGRRRRGRAGRLSCGSGRRRRRGDRCGQCETQGQHRPRDPLTRIWLAT